MWWSSAKILETKGFQFGGILTGIALDVFQEIPSISSASSDLKIKIFSCFINKLNTLKVIIHTQYI